MKHIIEKLKNKQDLSQGEIENIMRLIMSGEVAQAEIEAFLLSLRDKGATTEEITGAATILRQFFIPVETGHDILLDTCGTGGDKKHTFNISTLTALVVAAGGVAVAKHGNRSVSSKCGSADILEALGVNLDLPPQNLQACLDAVGIAFLFAQKHHPAMKNVAAARKALGVETIFNVLGPLLNPASATHQIMGVYNISLVGPIANVLKNLGAHRALVVHGHDGLDEITTTAKTAAVFWDGKNMKALEIDPAQWDIPYADEKDLKGGDLEENIEIFNNILNGDTGPKRDIVVLNAAHAFVVAEKAHDVAQGIDLAEQILDKGVAQDKLNELVAFTKSQ
ncbi:MAG: anthranilate phosphoribosyltransferase [Candidatus Omnitrophica bacterium]|nr:anthranilate phosphoribosyltransferase [Candidatus Omnitrophota bacterium]